MTHPTPATKPLRHATATLVPELPMSLLEAEVYRPRGALAAAVLVAPALVLLGLLAAATMLRHHDAMLAEILLGMAGGLVVMWMALLIGLARALLTTVRTTGEGIEVQLPWDERRLLRWKYVDLVERQMGFLRLQSSEGTRLLLLESSLTNGPRLLRQILLRVSPNVLSMPLQQELTMMGGGPTDPDATQLLTVSPLWFALASGIALVGVVLSLWGEFGHLLALLIAGIVVLALCGGVLFFFRQTITITEHNMLLERGFGRPQSLEWSQVAVIEMMPLQMLMAFRADNQRMVFLGPFFMAGLRADLWRSTVDVYLTSQGIPVFERWRVF